MFVATVALNQAVLFISLQHLYVPPLVTSLCEFRFAYEYPYSIFERYISRTYANVVYFSVPYVYPRAMSDSVIRYCVVRTATNIVTLQISRAFLSASLYVSKRGAY